MLRKILLGAIIFVLGSGALMTGAGLGLLSRLDLDTAPRQAQVLPATDRYREVPTLQVLLNSSETNQSIMCEGTTCKTHVPPSNVGSGAVFDGEGWYYYAGDALHRRTVGGEDSVITSGTDLVAPRDTLVHAPTTKAAYWLDNRLETDDKLTELWVYDAAAGGTKLVAEKLVGKDIITPPKWNSFGSALTFIADSGKGELEKLEFVTVTIDPAHIQARFASVDISKLEEAVVRGRYDVSPSTTALAFVTTSSDQKDILHTARDSGSVQRTAISGSVSYVQWIGEGILFYAVEKSDRVQFIRLQNASHTVIGEVEGNVLTALADETGSYITYVSEGALGATQLHVLETSSGLARQQSTLPRGLKGMAIADVDVQLADTALTSALSDGQLISFFQQHSAAMFGPGKTLTRCVITSIPNTLFVDLVNASGDLERALVVVRDAIHPEWEILARYEPAGGEWKKVEGGSDSEPKPLRLYEWEEGAGQWILKQELEAGS